MNHDDPHSPMTDAQTGSGGGTVAKNWLHCVSNGSNQRWFADKAQGKKNLNRVYRSLATDVPSVFPVLRMTLFACDWNPGRRVDHFGGQDPAVCNSAFILALHKYAAHWPRDFAPPAVYEWRQ